MAPSVVVRETRPEDDEVFARLFSMLMMTPYDAAALRERRRRYAHKEWFSRVAELDGQVVGILELVESGAQANAMLRIVVDPQHRGRGIGKALAEVASDHPLYSREKVFAETRDDEPASVRFIEGLGFAKRAHVFESFIDPGSIDLALFAGVIENVKASGLQLTTLAEIGPSDATRYKVWEIEHITDHDIPGLDPDQLPSWEDASKSWFAASWYDPASEFLAMEGDRVVGACGIAKFGEDIWTILHTCTLREYRGRGIATALKAIATDYARAKGSRHLKTNNHSGNEAMLSINRKFGFQPLPGWFEYTKHREVRAGDK